LSIKRYTTYYCFLWCALFSSKSWWLYGRSPQYTYTR